MLPFRILTQFFAAHNKHKSARRTVGDIAARFLSDRLTYGQMQLLFGSSVSAYTSWAKIQKLPAVIQDLDDQDAKLLWVGPKRTDRIIFFCHGGAFLVSLQPHMLAFCRSIQVSLQERGIEAGVVALAYGIAPSSEFPDQLRHAVKGIQSLIDTGVKPENIHLIGDSAGGNLIIQLCSHILHPLPDVTPLSLSTPFASACLISPWVSLTGQNVASFTSNEHSDWLAPGILRGWGARILQHVPDSMIAYAEPISAPKDWFSGLQTIVKRVFVLVGEAECLSDAIVDFESRLSKHHSKVVLFAEPGGVHEGIMMDFVAKQSEYGEGTRLILDWMAED